MHGRPKLGKHRMVTVATRVEPDELQKLRDLAEECGISGHTIKAELNPTYHIFERRGKWRFKPTYWYWMQIAERVDLTPQAEEAITQAVWVPLDKIRQEMPETYPTIEAAIRELIYKSVE